MDRTVRCHYAYLFELFFRKGAVIAAMALTACLSIAGQMADDESARQGMDGLPWGKIVLLSLGALLVFGGIVLLYCVFQWRHTCLKLREDALDYETGWFFRKRVSVPFNNVNTVALERNVFEKLTGTCRLKIDTKGYLPLRGEKQPDIEPVFELTQAYRLRRYILSRSGLYERTGADRDGAAIVEPKWTVRMRAGDFFLYGLTSSGIWKLIWLLILGGCVAAETSAVLTGKAVHAALPLLQNCLKTAEQWGVGKALLVIAGVYLALSLVSDIVTALWAWVKLFDFRAVRQGGTVLVRCGLFTEKQYTLQVRRIHAIVVRQTLLGQLTGNCSVEAVCGGFGNDKAETAPLFPLIPCKELNRYLDRLLPEYKAETREHSRSFAGLLFHAGLPTVIGGAVCFAVMRLAAYQIQWLLLPGLCGGIVVAGICLNGVLAFLHTALDWNSRIVSVQRGGFRRTLYRIRTNAVQEVRFRTDPFRAVCGLGTYYVHFHGPNDCNLSVGGHLPEDFFEPLADTVEN